MTRRTKSGGHGRSADALTAVRRLTHDVAVADPEVFRRRAKDANTAAALCYLIARANNLIGPTAAVHSKDFPAQFGVTSVSTRASTIRTAVLGRYGTESLTTLGSPRYLTSSFRSRLMVGRSEGPERARQLLAELTD